MEFVGWVVITKVRLPICQQGNRKVLVRDQTSCVLDAQGSLACWGNNHVGQANSPSGTFVDFEMGGVVCVWMELSCWGYDYHFVSVPLWGAAM